MISDVSFVRSRRAGSTVVPEVIEAQSGGDTTSAGLTHKRTKRALRAGTKLHGAPSKTGRKLSNYTFQRVQI